MDEDAVNPSIRTFLKHFAVTPCCVESEDAPQHESTRVTYPGQPTAP